jgi:transcriptional regulator with XRE-family HTH domain
MTESDDDLERRVDQLLKAVGQRFAEARASAQIGPVALADAAGISRNSLYILESGSNVELRTLLRAVLALRIHPADLFEDRPRPGQDTVTVVTGALAALLAALPPGIRRAAEELAAELASGDVPPPQ